MASFGEELRRQREVRGISLREISDATKINIRFLEALERNEFRHLPGGQFNKGFVRAFAGHIGVDPEGMVDAYLLELKQKEEGGRASGRSGETRTAAPRAARRLVGALIVLGAAAAIAAGIWWALAARGGVQGPSAERGFWSSLLDRWREPESASPRPAGTRSADRDAGAAGTPSPEAAAPGESDRRDAGGDAMPGGAGDARLGGATATGDAAGGAAGDAAAGATGNAAGGAAGAASDVMTGAGGDTAAGGAEARLPDDATTAGATAPGAGASALRFGSDPSPAPQGAAPDATLHVNTTPRGAPLVLRAASVRPVGFRLLCNGVEAWSGTLEPGAVLSRECSGVFEVSADDAGAVNVSVGGERLYLGRSGQPLTGRHVSSANLADYTNPPPAEGRNP